MATIIDSYSETNYDSDQAVNSVTFARGQSFTAISTFTTLDSVKFYFKKTGSPTGNGVAKIYAHSGTYGTSSVPTGTALATSDNFDVSTLTTSMQLINFTFSGVQRINLVPGTNYVVTFEYSGGDASNNVRWGRDASSAIHSGNASATSGSWIAGVAGTDAIFYVYGVTADTNFLVMF